MKMSYKTSTHQQIIDEFIDSGWECAKVCDWTNNNAGNCAASLNQSIKRFHRVGIKAISQQGHVYLVRC